MQVSIDTRQVAAYASRLKELHRSAFPIAVRDTLNSAAFDVKQRTMPAMATNTFVQRKPNFFKANSKVEKARGFDVAGMKSTVGFKPRGGKDRSVDELEQQEMGGKIKSRSFIAMRTARIGKNDRKSVRPINRVSEFNDHIIDADKVKVGKSKKELGGRRSRAAGSRKKQKFIRAAYKAASLWGDKGMVLGNSYRRKRTLSRIDEIWGSTRRQGQDSSRKLLIKRTPLYSYVKGRRVDVQATNFMKRASHESGLQLEKMFMQHARARVIKHMQRR